MTPKKLPPPEFVIEELYDVHTNHTGELRLLPRYVHVPPRNSGLSQVARPGTAYLAQLRAHKIFEPRYVPWLIIGIQLFTVLSNVASWSVLAGGQLIGLQQEQLALSIVFAVVSAVGLLTMPVWVSALLHQVRRKWPAFPHESVAYVIHEYMSRDRREAQLKNLRKRV